MALFVDVPDMAVPRSIQLYLIPQAIGSILLLKDEKPWLRHSLPIACLLTVALISSTNFAYITPLALPPGVRAVGRWFNGAMAMGDIAGFTPLAAKLAPEALVAMLSDIFARFDQCVEEFGLTKIKTIGDAFMVAAGIPSADPEHARKLVEFSRKLMTLVRDIDGIELRIGISSGDVVAGVIGQSRQVYDVWGDVVNMAARMESHGKTAQGVPVERRSGSGAVPGRRRNFYNTCTSVVIYS